MTRAFAEALRRLVSRWFSPVDRTAQRRRRRYRDKAWLAAEVLEDRTLLTAAPAQYVPTSVGSLPARASVVFTGDLNKDGHSDLVAGFSSGTTAGGSNVGGGGSASHSSGILVALNDAQPQPGFSQHFLSSGPGSSVVDLKLVDLDRDGDLDILTAVQRFDDDGNLRGQMDWWENSFNPADPLAPLSFTQHLVAKDIGTLLIGPNLLIDAGDVDGDGHVDIAALSGTSEGTPSDLLWFRNSGDAQNPTFQARYVARPQAVGNGPGGFLLADVDGDADLDFVVVTNLPARPGNDRAFIGSSLQWFENSAVTVGRTPNASGQIVDPMVSHLIVSSQNTRYTALEAGDLDGDGRLDIAAIVATWDAPNNAPGSRVEWHQQRSDTPGQFDRAVLDHSATDETARALALADLDGDDDRDIVVAYSSDFASAGRLRWYENDSTASFTATNLYEGDYDDIPVRAVNLHALAFADVDGDGDLDIVTGETAGGDGSPNPIVWYERSTVVAAHDTAWSSGLPVIIDILANDFTGGLAYVNLPPSTSDWTVERIEGNKILFTPAAGFQAYPNPVTFEYELVGVDGERSTASVTVVVFPSPGPPADLFFVDPTATGDVAAENWFRSNGTYYFDVLANDGHQVTETGLHSSGDVPLAIPDLSFVTSTLAVSDRAGWISDVNVTLDISHTFDADLHVFVIAPNGARVLLFSGTGGSRDNFTGTTLDDSAPTSIATGDGLFTGVFRPQGNLSDFNGIDPNGVWTLYVSDEQIRDVGTLNSWSLQITTVIDPSIGDFSQPAAGGVVGLWRSSNSSGLARDYLTFTPDTTYPGDAATFSYTPIAYDVQAGQWLEQPLVTVTVLFNEFNDPPRIHANALPSLSSLSPGVPVTVPLRQIVSDPETPFENLTITAFGAGVTATVSSDGETLTLTTDRPAGTLAFVYLIVRDDGRGGPAWMLDVPLASSTSLPVRLGSDFGDAPDTYGTSLARDGARHGAPATGVTPILGTSIDYEYDGQVDAVADGDDALQSDDEDGIRFLGPLWTTDTADDTGARLGYIDVTAPFGGVLQGWIDFNRNDVFDPDESLFGAGTVLGLSGLPSPTRTLRHHSPVVPLAIPDLSTITSTLNVSDRTGVITDLNVTLDLSHPWDADLQVFLIAPDGARVQLFAGVGGGGDNFAGTTLDDQAAAAIKAGIPPFAGTFRPAEPLSIFNGKSANGSWRLEVTDDEAEDFGILNSWSLEITTREDFYDGQARLTFTIPDGALAGDTDARFRISSTGGLGSTGYAADGEVEDYRITLVAAPPGDLNRPPEVQDIAAEHSPGEQWSDHLPRYVQDAETPVFSGGLVFHVSPSEHGVVSVDDSGYVTFTPDSVDFVGDATFTYTVTDRGFGSAPPASSTATVTLSYRQRADFGDAPESYQTAGHLLSRSGHLPRLGPSVDGASVGIAGSFDPHQDDDGVSLGYDADGMWTGLQSIGETNGIWVSVTAATPAYLDAWIDFDRNGSFDASEYVVLREPAATFITRGSAPFAGTYRPEGSLAAFEGTDANGTWRLEVADDSLDDVGGLVGWSLEITTQEDGPNSPSVTLHHSSEDVPKSILDLSTIFSSLDISGRTGTITDVNVTLDISHTWDSDLDVYLIAPNGARVELFTDVGEGGDNFRGTTLDDEAIFLAGYLSPGGSLRLADGLHFLTYEIPPTAELGPTQARFRLSSAGGLPPGGFAADGEMEDYAIRLTGHVGARDDSVHTDAGQSVLIPVADNDDVNPYAAFVTIVAPPPVDQGTAIVSSDGTTIRFTPAAGFSGTTTFEYRLSNAAGPRDTAAVQVVVRPLISAFQGETKTIDLLSIEDPQGATAAGQLQFHLNAADVIGGEARLLDDGHTVEFRAVSDIAGPSPLHGYFDYTVTDTGATDPDAVRTVRMRVAIARFQDFGDAPDRYDTTLANNGARHNVPVSGNRLYLGRIAPDAEEDGQPLATANGEARGDDDHGQLNDEDGVIYSGIGEGRIIQVIAPHGGMLDAWIDFNRDGEFEPVAESLFLDASNHAVSRILTPGINSIVIALPSDAKLGTTFARFRLSSAGGLLPTGPAPDGEVEDYLVEIVDAPPAPIFNDAVNVAVAGFTTLINSGNAGVPASATFTGAGASTDFTRGVVDVALQLVLDRFAATLAAGRAAGEFVFGFAVDPVPNIRITDPQGRHAEHVGGVTTIIDRGFQGTIRYSGDGPIEAFEFRSAAAGRYLIEFSGESGIFRGGATFLTPGGQQSAQFQGRLGDTNTLVLALDFSAPPPVAQGATTFGQTASTSSSSGQGLLSVSDPVLSTQPAKAAPAPGKGTGTASVTKAKKSDPDETERQKKEREEKERLEKERLEKERLDKELKEKDPQKTDFNEADSTEVDSRQTDLKKTGSQETDSNETDSKETDPNGSDPEGSAAAQSGHHAPFDVLSGSPRTSLDGLNASPDLVAAFWQGLGRSLFEGNADPEFHLAELLGPDVPLLFPEAKAVL